MNRGRDGLQSSPKGEPVQISAYDPAWPVLFVETRARLCRALDNTALRIDHIGSTAVPGLDAKPVIDVQVSVPNLTDEAAYRPALESLGLVLRYRDGERRFFRPPESKPRTLHVHVCESGGVAERNHLLFTAYLRAHPERRDEYAVLKRDLARSFRDRREEYLAAKEPFIEKTLELAEEWHSRASEPL